MQAQVSWLSARGIQPPAACGYSLLIDAPVPANPAEMCTSVAAAQAKVMNTLYYLVTCVCMRRTVSVL
jgi:hypothetical protein